MEKWTRQLTEKLDLLQKRVEALLEEEPSPSAEKLSTPFEPSRDLALLRGLSVGLPEDHVDKAILVLSRLSLLYDGGLLLRNEDGAWTVRAYFAEGWARPLKISPAPIIQIPSLGPLQALQTNADDLLNRASLQISELPRGCRALLLKPTPDFAYILMSKLPDLWLKDHAAATMKSLGDSFA